MPAPRIGSSVVIRRRHWRVVRTARDGSLTRLDVTGGGEGRTFLVPFDRPEILAAPKRPRMARVGHLHGRLAALMAHTHGIRSVPGALAADISILPWQLEATLAFLSGTARVLVADEVGLGKTIQAGLVVAEVVRREIAPRVLVVVPAGLRVQWTAELTGRFRIDVEPIDRLTMRDRSSATLAKLGGPPPGVWIASPDFLKQAHVLEALPPALWDLIVIDEAHEVCGESERHAACDWLARRSRRVLLLTATPHAGDDVRYRRLRNLGRLGDELQVLGRTRTSLGLPSSRRVRWLHVGPSPAEQHALAVLAGFERRVLAAGRGGRQNELLLLSVLRKRALSTMHALALSASRRLTWTTRQPSADEPDWAQPVLDWEDDQDHDLGGLTATIGLGRQMETVWLERLVAAAEAAVAADSKLRRLVRLLSSHHEPVIVFTEFRDSLVELQRRLAGLRQLAVLHGGLTPDERESQLGNFLAGRADALVATDVASQGLNLQARARWVVNLELPWTPARLVQRAGRVDRLGQRRRVHVSCLLSRHEAESGLLARLARRALAARAALAVDTGTTPPGERDVATALLLHRPPSDDTRAALANAADRRGDQRKEPGLARQARAESRLLGRRRALVGRWRCPEWSARRPIRATLRRRSDMQPDTTLVFSVGIRDGLGRTLEERVVAVRIAGTSGRPWSAERRIVEAARRAVVSHLQARARRVRRLTARALDASLRREGGILAHLNLRMRTEAQPGLFDGRARGKWERARRDIERLSDAAATRAREEADRLETQVQPPVLELILDRC